jgi:hypothetical protein
MSPNAGRLKHQHAEKYLEKQLILLWYACTLLSFSTKPFYFLIHVLTSLNHGGQDPLSHTASSVPTNCTCPRNTPMFITLVNLTRDGE